MANIHDNVDGFMTTLDHPRKSEIEELRISILGARSGITERIKWNAPSFCYHDDDRVTFRLQPGNRVELIFHRGAKVRSESDAFAFEDRTGLLKWASSDRGVVTVADRQDLRAKKADIVNLVTLWMGSTAD
ncbi:MAG: DUF1801 domain-containing protein [Actinomycetota bacterium]